MKKSKLMRTVFVVLVALAVLATCENNFIVSILPSRDKTDADVQVATAGGSDEDNGGTPSGYSYITSSTGIELASIPAGTFMMGSPESANNNDNEIQHSVTLTKSFYMGKYQVTQEQYQMVMGSNPSNFSSSPQEGETQGKRPVERVRWYDALVFCNKLSMMEGLDPVYSIGDSDNPADWGAIPASNNAVWNGVVMDMSKNGYRLPTEAEWEYACRAETTTAYNMGDTISDDTGWYKSNSGDKTHEVGLKPANAWGLHDMHGNVWEWCWDWYNPGYYSSSPTNDPLGASSGPVRVVRGGSWYNSAENLRSAYRGGNDPNGRYINLGFRLVRP
ncbi:MAG: formylglycine-generating enzyme family protein [Spirochaetes bacterium]|nr:formylglycine-generating enzyme family protein [Spirochaetota bacterium]